MSREGWKRKTWGELVVLEYGKSLRTHQDSVGNIPVYGTNGPIGYTTDPLCQFPSVIIGRKGAYRGVHYSNTPFFVIDTAFYLRPISEEIDLHFAYYQLLTQDINSMDSGSAIPSTSREDFYNLEVDLPPLEIQRRITSILSALDDKIELNRQTNATLEAMAQAIFKEWFVDFNFPGATDEMQDSELGPIPKGWTVSKIRDCASRVQYGLTQAASPERIGPSFLRITDIQGGRINWSTVPFCRVTDADNQKYKLQNYDVVVARTGASTGESALLINPPEAVFASYLVRLQFENAPIALYVGKFMRTEPYTCYVEAIKSGSAQPNANAQQLSDFEVVIPADEVLRDYYRVVADIENHKAELDQQSQTLVRTRDKLLPRLISGKLRVGEVD